ncbi:uncharacterized protein TRIVIDRAFT_221132 [Trichoderma virens Gv29-8]|uniref:Uncharacterized protein n=1 Tax=Hypocrea virens (strain Gv29-8 / FGSC 10586) TaxID=413071 RepID=G9MPT2_HYPVG|nr:uncharacterized protein TRIVIDRAFT_221132 [Trichoderma virens Gv29-8]EHK23882.1 hypothetical protein TRIVIDRAFT_221132 [Trichoderma virens Gv29-8]UKZ50188.1 hypothetical protein TrVGV298_004444 [Trichoderma virens]
MTDSFSRYLFGSSSDASSARHETDTNVTNTSQTLYIGPSTTNPNLSVVQYEGTPQSTPPLYSIAPHAMLPGMFIVYRGLPDPTGQTGPIGHIKSSSEHSAELNLRGCAMKLKMSQLTGDYSITGTPMGKLKWKANALTGCSSLTLCDSHGKKLAKTKTKKAGLGDQKIEMLVLYDEMVVEIAVLTAYQTKVIGERVVSTVLEVVQAMAGT